MFLLWCTLFSPSWDHREEWIEPSISWAICSKAVKIKNNWVSEPLCHVKSVLFFVAWWWIGQTSQPDVVVTFPLSLAFHRKHKGLKERLQSCTTTLWRKSWIFSYRKDKWPKCIYGLTTNHQMSLLPVKLWHLSHILQKRWEYNRWIEKEGGEEFSHWKVKQFLDLCILKNQHLNDTSSCRSYLQLERSRWKEKGVNASYSVCLTLVLQFGII